MSGKPEEIAKSENIFLFVPNIIGYARIVLAFISFYFMPKNYVVAVCCYVVSALLDAFDGHAARYFNQSTKFGGMLDQLTDRCGTMGLCAVLAHFYPDYMFWFIISMCIDIACHWLYLHSSILQGKSSHKFIDMSENSIMNLYYTNRNVLFFMCFGNEAFYSSLYLFHFTPGPLVMGISLFKICIYLFAPIALVKSGISLLHLVVASRNLGIIDMNERKIQKKVD